MGENDAKLFTDEELEEFTADSVKIDPVDLNREFCELAPRLAFWNARLADATEKAMETKADLEMERARKLLEVREELRLNKDKATVDEVNAKVLLDDDVSDAHAVYIGAEAERIRTKGIVEAILCKRDMLQSLGAKIRAEMAGDPILRSQLAGASGMEFGDG